MRLFQVWATFYNDGEKRRETLYLYFNGFLYSCDRAFSHTMDLPSNTWRKQSADNLPDNAEYIGSYEVYNLPSH